MPSRLKKQVRPRSIKIRRLKTDTFTCKRKVVKSEMSEPGDLSKTEDRVNKNDGEVGNISNPVDLSESNDPNILQKLFDDLLTENDLAKKELQVFSKITNVTRRCLANVGHLVSNYYRLKDAEAKLAKVHSRFLIYCGKSEEALESENHALKSSYADSIFDEWGEILDNCKIAFKLVKDKYPESDMVVNYLDFVDGKTVATKVEKDGSVGSFNSSESAVVGKGEDYVKKKVPKIKKEIEDRFSILSDNFHSGKTTSLEGLKELCSKLENLEEKLSDSGSFE